MACDVSRVVMFLCERVLKEDLVFFYSVSELFPNKASDCRGSALPEWWVAALTGKTAQTIITNDQNADQKNSQGWIRSEMIGSMLLPPVFQWRRGGAWGEIFATSCTECLLYNGPKVLLAAPIIRTFSGFSFFGPLIVPSIPITHAPKISTNTNL